MSQTAQCYIHYDWHGQYKYYVIEGLCFYLWMPLEIVKLC